MGATARGPRTDVRLPPARRGAILSGIVLNRSRLAIALAALAVAVTAVLAAGPPARADEAGGDRAEARVEGVCGTGSRSELRLRGDGDEIRVEARVRTGKRGVWRVSVFHERRLVVRARVRSTSGGRGFRYRAVLPDFEGPDAVRVRATAPTGETCTVGATLPGS